MICPRCSVAEIAPDTNRCELCGYTLLGTRPVAIQPAVADEVLETVQRELADRFDLHVLVRRERGSTLYLARDLEDDQLVSLRLIPRQGPIEGPLIHRFAQTATLAAQFRHPHLVGIRKHGVTNSLLWYSTDPVKSRTLGMMLDHSGPMTLPKTLELLEQIASGLEYLHRNAVVHGGVGRNTVLVDAEGWVRVSDPGTAAAIYRAAGPGVGWEALLDLAFAAPELLERRLMGPAADQYSLAVIAYFCLTGRPPHAGESVDGVRRERTTGVVPLDEIRAELPPYAVMAILRALRDDPSERFGSVLDFVAVLGGAAVRPSGVMLAPSGRPSAAQVVVIPDGGAPPARRWWPWLAVLVGIAGLAAGAYAGWTRLRPQPEPQWAIGPVVPESRPVVPVAPVDSAQVADTAPVVSAPPVERPPIRPQPAAGPPGTLFVNATPWGSLYVDGRLVGNTPQASLQLTRGTHLLRVVRDGFVPFERQVTVRGGDTLRITDIVLQPLTP